MTENLKLKERKWLKPQSNLPYGVASLTEHLSKNPDRYFKGVSTNLIRLFSVYIFVKINRLFLR